MKKLTSFGGNILMGATRQRLSGPILTIAIFFLYAACFTSATAQAISTGRTICYVFNKPGGGAETRQASTPAHGNMNGHVIFYPDIVSDYLLVMLPAAANANTLVAMSDADGKILATDTIAAGAINTILDMKHMPAGTYMVTIGAAADKQVLRLVKN